MRRLSLFVAALLLVACGGGKETPEKPSVVPAITLSPQTINLTAAGTPVSVNISSNVAWTATPSSDWVSVSTLTGTGNATVQVSATANTGALRKATVTFTDKDNKLARTLNVNQSAAGSATVVPAPDAFDGTKRSDLTYQLLVYSFCDSDGDGWGDLKGVESKLDYLDEMGVTALWLSPVHPSDSYHGYDVTDYYGIHPKLGSEADFQDLINSAHAKGIKIYMDYVLNHSGKGHPWFKEALADPESPYRNYYFISSNPSVEYSSFPMLKYGSWTYSYNAGEWKLASGGSPKITITATNEDVQTGTSNWNLYWWNGSGDNTPRFKDNGDGTLSMVIEINGTIGLLVRKYMNWENGSKYGAKNGGTITLGTPCELVADGADMSFTGNGKYKITLSDVSNANSVYFMGAFGEWMPDLNYGDVTQAESNACFIDLANSADKWLNMGVDGFRLDAVKHICGGMNSYNNGANQTLLKKWYDRCNTTYKNAGHSDDIFMVGEAWLDHSVEKDYYKGLQSCFEFDYWGKLTYAVNDKVAMYFAKDVMTFINSHKNVRSDAITSIFLTNHDAARAAEGLGKNLAKEKQAAALLLTSTGKPFIYQGEELGYWGNQSQGDEYVRAPIKWTKMGNVPTAALGGKVDNGMLSSSISVEAQKENESSLLNVYKAFARVRNTYHALAKGTMKEHGTYNSNNTSYPSIGCWYMEYGTEKMLVVHNTETTAKTISLSGEDLTKPVALLGTASIAGSDLTLGGNSSVIFKLY